MSYPEIVFILGAGASYPYGLPLASCVDYSEWEDVASSDSKTEIQLSICLNE